MGCGCFFLVAGRRAWYWRVRLTGVPSYSEASSAAAWGAELGPSSRQSTEAFRRISFPWFLARDVRTWKYGALFPYGFALGSPVSGVRVLLVEYRLDSLGDAAILWGAMLGSTVDTCSVWMLLEEYSV